MNTDMTEIVRGMDPSWFEPILMKMATKFPNQFYESFAECISENASRNARVAEENSAGTGESNG